MKKYLFFVAMAIMLFAACGGNNDNAPQKEYNKGINILPMPQSLVQNEGFFKLNTQTNFFAETAETQSVAEFFAKKMRAATGSYPLNVTDKAATKNVISLLIDSSLDVNEEGYTLDVTTNAVTVKAKTPEGLFYGMQTFLQLLPAEIESTTAVADMNWAAPCVTVKDEPRFLYRGIMLDACRHFIPVDDMKKQIDAISMFKINRLHWHLTEDQGWRIEIKKYPKLTEIGSIRKDGEGMEYGGFYTQEQIKEIVAYAAERFITIVPEIEIPGHELAAISAYPELSCTGEQVKPRIVWGIEDVVMCPGKASTFEFLENVFAEVLPLFPGEYVHIGGDECPKIFWKKCPACQKKMREEGLKNEEELQSYVVRHFEKFLAGYGKKIIGWDEILEGGVSDNATIMSWRGEEGGIEAANLHHNVIMTPSRIGLYIDYYQGDSKIEPVAIGGYNPLEKVYNYKPVPDTLVKAGLDKYIYGVQCNLWGEYLYDTKILEYRGYPRFLALSEIAWSQQDKKDFTDFLRRLNNGYVRLDGHNINYYIPQPEQPNGSCNFVAFTDKARLEFKTTFPVKMVYTTDGSAPNPESTVYEQPLDFSQNTTLKIRSVLPSGKMSPVRTITIEKQSLAPAKEVTSTKPGLKMQYADGMYLESSYLNAIKDWKETTIKSLKEITSRVSHDDATHGKNHYAAIASGYVNIPEDGVYFVSSDLEEVWLDGQKLIDNKKEVKRFSRNDKSIALGKGLHELKVVFLSHIIGGWPSAWNDGSVRLRKSDAEKFEPIKPEQLFY